MKTIRMFCNALMSVALTSLMIWSCTKVEAGLEQEETRTWRTIPVVFNATLMTYDAQTRAEATSWDDHSQVFLQFSVGDGFVDGTAVYDASADMWYVEPSKPIITGQELTCHAYYFENPTFMDGANVELNEKSVIYRDTTATYFYDESSISINAHLVPITGRVRFEGNPGASYCMGGMRRYTDYSIVHNKLTSTGKDLTFILPESGKSDYYYLFFDELAPREMNVYDRANNVKYTKKCSPGILAHGKSGYMNLPSSDSHIGWSRKELVKTYQIDSISFNMILVDKGTFDMGWGPTVVEEPIHKVTLTRDYYVGETEVTNSLWCAVMGDEVPDGRGEGPLYGESFSAVEEFISKLNRIIEDVEFRLPTEAEWEFAAKGGNKSEGYAYSGSNDLGRVGYYYGYTTSSIKPCDVKSYSPNELGIYDMSGNVCEWCADSYADYPSEPQIDPLVDVSGNGRVWRGGHLRSVKSGQMIGDKSFCTTTHRGLGGDSNYSSYVGFRLASY